MAHTAEDGKIYQVQFCSLDVILAVGYRINSKKAIEDVKALLPTGSAIDHDSILELVTLFAYTFVWFLRHAKVLDLTPITPPALTAITLLIAENVPINEVRHAKNY